MASAAPAHSAGITPCWLRAEPRRTHQSRGQRQVATKISFMNDLVWLILTATKEEATEGADALVIFTE